MVYEFTETVNTFPCLILSLVLNIPGKSSDLCFHKKLSLEYASTECGMGGRIDFPKCYRTSDSFPHVLVRSSDGGGLTD